jgi:CRISPR-associated endonuclease/helicase Cas3
MMKNLPIAHFRKKDQKPQYLYEHLENVSTITGILAGKIALKEAGMIMGLLHDLGKGSEEFQNYIRSAIGLLDPDADGYMDANTKKGRIDHSTAGAQIIFQTLHHGGLESQLASQVLSLCIASHHSGLIDCLSPDGIDLYNKRIEKQDEFTHLAEVTCDLSQEESQKIHELLNSEILWKQINQKLRLLKEESDSRDTYAFKCGLLIRFLFSCLIDADRLDTADFESPSNQDFRNYGQYHPWQTLIDRLDIKLREFESKEDKNEVDDLRNHVSQSCYEFSKQDQGIYQLTVPTGGGKTLASLRFALNHAAHHNLERIIYVIPYTSIIDQNANEVRKILEDKDNRGKYLDRVVLEHHSNLTPEEESYRHNLLSENWDAPVIFTTQVQFLEALFGSKTRGARRMHQLAKSVIIFDEVQTIPVRCVHIFNIALRFLVHDCGSTIVLCTATQPLLDRVEPVHRSLTIKPENKMITEGKIKRYEISDHRKPEGWTDEEVADLAEQELQKLGSVLIIVNTKKSARSLYKVIQNRRFADVYHLSTNMCPAHRLKVLEEVKEKIDKQPVICVSTQLIEAGVDIDFGSVIRYLAGLDSIIQAAGRCNRNGQRPIGNVLVVNPRDENIDQLIDIRKGKEQAERVFDEFIDHPEAFDHDRSGRNAIETYYKYYFYDRKEEMCYRVDRNSPAGRDDDLFNLLGLNKISLCEYQRINNSLPGIAFRQSFKTAAEAFHAIDSATRGVVVPFGKEGEQIIADLCGAFDLEKQYGLVKKAQRYAVNMFPQEFKRMVEKKAIQEVQEGAGIFYLDGQYYSNQFGWSEDSVNVMKTLII